MAAFYQPSASFFCIFYIHTEVAQSESTKPRHVFDSDPNLKVHVQNVRRACSLPKLGYL